MGKATDVWNPLKPKKEVAFRKAEIDVHYEDCSQIFNRLCTSYAAFVSKLPETRANTLTDCFGRFTAWGVETGAREQALDHKLRKNNEMHDHVVELLVQLQNLLGDALQLLENESIDAVPDEKEDSFVEEISPDDTTGFDPLNAQPIVELADEATELFELVEETVENLITLAPSLSRPYPQDIDVYSSTISSGSSDDLAEIELAKQMFPSASGTLQIRLGHANYKRRVAQKALRDQPRLSSQAYRVPKGGKAPRKQFAGQEIAQDAFNFQRPTMKSPVVVPYIPLLSVPSSATPSEADVRSIFSKAVTTTTFTNFSTAPPSERSMKPRTHTAKSVSLEVPFPKIPVELDKGKIQLFKCNLCGYDLEAGAKIKTEDDWKQHVLEDLEPYLCTFDDCFSAQEMYAIRDDWYRHELEQHRIKRVWVCDVCDNEFSTRNYAEQHLSSHKDEFDQDEITIMKKTLRPILSNKNVVPHSCPLCRNRVSPGETKVHIARHLEYFALLSVQGDDSSGEDESDEIFSQSASENDAMSERGRKEAVLNNFVKEQLKLNLERGKQPPDRYVDGSNPLQFFDDKSDYDGSNDSESRIGGPRIGQRNVMLERMLLQGAADQLVESGRPRRHTGATLLSVDVPPSLASSTHLLPILRTWSFPRNDEFMGRDKELANLYKILSEPGRVCVVSAEGGMGKTALAVEFSYRFEQSYHYIFWIQAETPVGSSETFCQIALQLNLASEGTDQDTLIRLGREFLEQEQDKRWLLIFDNVDKWDDIDAYTPTKTSITRGSILITTRHETLTAPSRPVNYFRITLQELDVDEGRKLLIHGLPPDLRPEELSLTCPDYKIAGEIARLAGLPLLIVFISGYIKQSACSLQEFWEYWDEWRPKARGSGGSAEPTGSSNRDSVFNIALRDLGGDARKILKIMAFLDSDGIQKELLVRNDNVPKPGPNYLRTTRFRIIIANLIGQKFVNETRHRHDDREIYTVHRVLQSRLLQDMNSNPKERDEIFRIAFELIRYHLPRPSLDTPEPSKWNAFKEYLPHVLSLQRGYADPLSITTPTPFHGLAELFKDGGVLLWQRYIHSDALRLLKSAEHILDELESDDEGLRADINITISLLLQYFGISHRKESKERLGKILEFRKKVIAEKQPEEITQEDEMLVTNARADYANALLQFNNYGEAEPIYERCLLFWKRLDASDPNVAFSLAKLNHHMAYCKMYRRQFDEAIRLATTAVDIIDQLGDRQITLRYQFDLACIILQSGDKEKALALHRDILDARLGFQGRASYFSLQSQYAYASICNFIGRYDEAEHWMRFALRKASERGGKNFWPDAAVARTKYHLSQVLKNKAGGVMSKEAEELAKESKDVLSKMLPYDPDPILGVREEDTGALFDHLQPVFGGRFTGMSLLSYVGSKTS